MNSYEINLNEPNKILWYNEMKKKMVLGWKEVQTLACGNLVQVS